MTNILHVLLIYLNYYQLPQLEYELRDRDRYLHCSLYYAQCRADNSMNACFKMSGEGCIGGSMG